MILIYLAAGWIAGIFAASWLELPTPVWLLLALIPLGYLLLFWRSAPLRVWHIVLIFLVLGALRYQLALPGESERQLAQYNEQGRVSLVGIVTADPEVRQTETRLSVDVSKIRVDGEWRDTHGRALVSAPRDTPARYGDEVQVDGAPETPPHGADFSYRDYLARESVLTLVRYAQVFVISSEQGSPFWATLYRWRESAEHAIAQLLPEPSAALLTGILLGNDRNLPPAVREAFNRTNTAHILAISGYNIAVLIAVLAFLLRRPAVALEASTRSSIHPAARASAALARHLVTILILGLLALYTLLVGASASVVRACIMGALVVLALEFGRQSWAFTALALAAFLMTLANPYVVWDVGFQLSFLATLGLLLYAPRWQASVETWLTRRADETRARQLVHFFKDALIVTAAAFLATAPLIVLYFHRLSLIGFLTNLLVLPAQPLIMILGGAATLLQLAANALAAVPLVAVMVGALAQVAAWGAFIFLQYTLLVVEATAAVPFGSFEVARVDLALVVLFYAGLLLVTGLGVRRALGLVLAQAWTAVALLALATMLVWTTALAAPDPRTRVAFVAASSGDATLIRTAEERRILINGTDEPATLLSFLGTQLPPWDRRIDLVVATHLDDENTSSLNAVLERYAVGQVLEPAAPKSPGASYEKWRMLIEQKQLQVIPAEVGTRLRAGEVQIEVVYGTKDDAAENAAEGLRTNAALRVDAQGQSFLLAPALNQSDRAQMAQDGALFDADLAVFPNAIDEEWVARVTPAAVIFFVGRSPREQPSAETLKRLEGAAVLRTDERGTISYILDGNQVQIRAER